MTTPFTSNKSQKKKYLNAAEKKVIEAIRALNFAKAGADNWAEFSTISEFQHQLEEFLSCDSGECGLTPYMKTNNS